jgi:hypothetical protein
MVRGLWEPIRGVDLAAVDWDDEAIREMGERQENVEIVRKGYEEWRRSREPRPRHPLERLEGGLTRGSSVPRLSLGLADGIQQPVLEVKPQGAEWRRQVGPAQFCSWCRWSASWPLTKT